MSNNSRLWKIIDLVGQIGIIIIPGVWYSYHPISGYTGDGDEGRTVFTTLPAIGMWQIASFLIHIAFMRRTWISLGRKIYAILLGTFVLFGLLFFSTAGNDSDQEMFGYIVFFGGIPLMGLFYLIITITELVNINKMRGRTTEYPDGRNTDGNT